MARFPALTTGTAQPGGYPEYPDVFRGRVSNPVARYTCPPSQEENMFRRTSCHFHDEQFDRDTDRYTPDKTALLNAEARLSFFLFLSSSQAPQAALSCS